MLLALLNKFGCSSSCCCCSACSTCKLFKEIGGKSDFSDNLPVAVALFDAVEELVVQVEVVVLIVVDVLILLLLLLLLLFVAVAVVMGGANVNNELERVKSGLESNGLGESEVQSGGDEQLEEV